MFIIFSLKSIIKQLLDLVYGFLHLKCITKQLLDSVFVICKIINVPVRIISRAEGEADITLISTLTSQKPHPIIDCLLLLKT